MRNTLVDLMPRIKYSLMNFLLFNMRINLLLALTGIGLAVMNYLTNVKDQCDNENDGEDGDVNVLYETGGEVWSEFCWLDVILIEGVCGQKEDM